jgi:hypothetical protein
MGNGEPFAGLGRVPFIRHLWEAHTVHHLQAITANYGFIGMFWDRRFGTDQDLALGRLKQGEGAPGGAPPRPQGGTEHGAQSHQPRRRGLVR